jgi:prolyl 4-hydroxylase
LKRHIPEQISPIDLFLSFFKKRSIQSDALISKYSCLFFLFLPYASAAGSRIPTEINERNIFCKSPEIFVVENFADDTLCEHLVRVALPHLKHSTVVDLTGKSHGVIDSGRTSSGMYFPPMLQDKHIDHLEKKIAQLTSLPQKNGEWIQVLRYKPSQEYRPHYDFFDPQTLGGVETLKRGGQRVVTCILYLKEPLVGGETVFPLLGVSIPPKKGSLLVFYNCDEKGQVFYETLHGGAPVIEGEKWIATKWIRQKTFH